MPWPQTAQNPNQDATSEKLPRTHASARTAKWSNTLPGENAQRPQLRLGETKMQAFPKTAC
eukprot:10839838-Lingulodinium_polyedra.AAC.1